MNAMSTTPLDRRVNAWREDLAAEELRGTVPAARYTTGTAARVVASRAPIRQRPDPTSPLDTEALFGEIVRVLDVAGGWAWVQLAKDRYVGYVPVDRLSTEIVPATHRVQALATFVYPHPDIKAPPIMTLCLGSEIAVGRADERFAELAGGGFVVPRHLAGIGSSARDFVDVAERFIGTPYLWGGRSRSGLDCSGLVQLALQAAGIPCPRDSDMQQDALGETVLTPQNLEGLERGDLVFWPGHVGIMVDGVMLLHANAYHMVVAVETLAAAVDRIARAGSRISTVKRLPGLSLSA